MKCVFLDLDGVLNHLGWYAQRGSRDAYPSHLAYNIDPACVARVNRLCAATGARLVFSSAWRGSFRLPQLNRAFRQIGCTARFVGITPSLREQPRGAEIAAWLAAHGPITAFCILDDAADMAELRPRLVQVDPYVGLSDFDVEWAMALLRE